MEKFTDMKMYEKYKNIKGKTDSMYVYVLFNCDHTEIMNHIKKQSDILERVNDSYKRKLFQSRYFLLREMIEASDVTEIFNCVIFLGDILERHELSKENLGLLNKFKHQKITFTYDSSFNLEFLEDLLFNNDPCHLFRVDNNKVEYIQMTKTKKIIVRSKESKLLDLKAFIDENISSKTRYILCGISSKLNDIKDTRSYGVINGFIKDNEIDGFVRRMYQEELIKLLKEDLTLMQNQKTLHRIVFKQDLTKIIRESKLQKLYIDSTLKNKFLSNMEKSDLIVDFKLISLDKNIKSFSENDEKILDSYSGIVGVTYY